MALNAHMASYGIFCRKKKNYLSQRLTRTEIYAKMFVSFCGFASLFYEEGDPTGDCINYGHFVEEKSSKDIESHFKRLNAFKTFNMNFKSHQHQNVLIKKNLRNDTR